MYSFYAFITNTFPVVAAIVCFYAAIRLYKKYKQINIKTVGYFAGFFLCKFLAFTLIIAAIIIALNSGSNAISNNLMAFGVSSMVFGLIFIGAALINFTRYKYDKTIIYIYLLLIIISVLYLILNLFHLPRISPASETKMGVDMMIPNVSAWYLLIAHLCVMTSLGIIFLAKIPSLTVKPLKTRSLLIGLGLIFSSLGGPFFFFASQKSAQALMLSITLTGYILIFLGVLLYRETADA